MCWGVRTVVSLSGVSACSGCNECVELALKIVRQKVSVLSLSFERMDVGSLLRKSVLNLSERSVDCLERGMELDCGMSGI
jgi:hypothetical protein